MYAPCFLVFHKPRGYKCCDTNRNTACLYGRSIPLLGDLYPPQVIIRYFWESPGIFSHGQQQVLPVAMWPVPADASSCFRSLWYYLLRAGYLVHCMFSLKTSLWVFVPQLWLLLIRWSHLWGKPGWKWWRSQGTKPNILHGERERISLPALALNFGTWV